MVSISVAKLFRISKASEGLPRDQDIIFIMIYYNSWLWLWFWLFCRQRNSGFVKFIYQYCSEFKIQLTTPVSREIFPLFIKATKKKWSLLQVGIEYPRICFLAIHGVVMQVEFLRHGVTKNLFSRCVRSIEIDINLKFKLLQ